MPRFLDETGLTKLWSKIINSIVTNTTKISENIITNGGPLASNEMKEVFPGGIRKGDNMQSILEKMFCRDIYPSPSVSDPNIT